MTKKQKRMLRRILISAVCLIILLLIPTRIFDSLDSLLFVGAGRILRFVLYFGDYLLIGHDILWSAIRGIKNRRLLDENFLMAIATVGALALAVYENGEYTEAIAVMLFYQIGEFFQSYAIGKSRRSIAALMDIRPDHANIECDGELVKIDPDEVAIGSVITVLPGEKIPLDGIVLEGESHLDTSALTGESLPRRAKVQDEVISGCICMNGMLKIKTTKEFGESTVSKILELVENASSRKSKSENFISRFAKHYTPAVCIAAAALAVLPPLFALILSLPPRFGTWLYRALTFLVISCPCALVVSIPLGFFAGLGGASREGILIKGSHYLEALASVKTVMFDKTGTLTAGNFKVQKIHSEVIEENELLEYAALAESYSTHPIAESLREAFPETLASERVKNVREKSGMGLLANIDGKEIAIGNEKLMASLGIPAAQINEHGTVVYVAIDNAYQGYILISDTIKPTSEEAIRALRRAGITKTVMLTGDNKAVAEHITAALALDDCHSELLPADKVTMVEKALSEKHSGKLAFVGDGINDAPVLAGADIGIAMGAMGSDAAIEAADIVLMDDDPMKIAKAIRISRKCMSVIRQNIVFALAIKFACLALGAIGHANMYLAIFADVGVMVLAVLNAIRCLFVKKL